MGCDIHSAVEIKQDGQWKMLNKFGEDHYEGEDPYIYVEDKEPVEDRNYRLFAMLADVRNGRGFAGIDTGNALVPIHDPRGVPDDCSPEYRRWVDQWDCDGHSHSWATLGELLRYDLRRTVTERGVVDIAVYNKWRRWGKDHGESPKGWCGSITGPSIRIVSMAEADAMLDVELEEIRIERGESEVSCDARRALASALGETDGFGSRRIGGSGILPGVHVYCEWVQYYHQLAGELTRRTIPELCGIMQDHGLDFDDVRIVYFFDS